MTALPLVLGLASIGTAIGLGVLGVAGRRAGAAAPAGADLGPAVPVTARPAARARREEATALHPAMRRFAALAARLTPGGYARRAQHRLDLAGNPPAWTAERLLAMKGAGLLVGALLGLVVGTKHSAVLGVLFAAVFGGLAFLLPDLIVRNLGEKRQIALAKGLPDAMDMLTVCVEAGLGFDAALARVARNIEGPAADEWSRVLQEMQFGVSRSNALRALGERTDVPELSSFVSAMVQSTQFGISIGDVLREQSKQMRIKRRQRAEEQAQKLQVKLLLPLITCLLPAMFVVVVGPAAINIVHFFASTKG